MIIEPKARGFICVTTHPTGCDANVLEQINQVKKKGKVENGPKKVLVIGASTGYGLASRISAAFGSGAATIGVFFEKQVQQRDLVQQVGTTLLHLQSMLKKQVYMHTMLMQMLSQMSAVIR